MLALIFGLIELASNFWTSAPVPASLAAALVLLASFVWWEHRAPVPMIPPAVVKLRSFTTSCGVYLLSYASLTGVYFYLTLLYQDVDGWTALRTGLSWLFMNIPFLVMAHNSQDASAASCQRGRSPAEAAWRRRPTGHRPAAEQAFSHGYQVAVLIAGLGLIAAAIIVAFGLRDNRRRELDAAAGKLVPPGDPAQPHPTFVTRPDGEHDHVNH